MTSQKPLTKKWFNVAIIVLTLYGIFVLLPHKNDPFHPDDCRRCLISSLMLMTTGLVLIIHGIRLHYAMKKDGSAKGKDQHE